MNKNILIFGALMGLLAVIAGAAGSHFLVDKVSEAQLKSFDTAVKFQFYHALSILLIQGLQKYIRPKFITAAGLLFASGIVFFSGSLYIIATQEITGITLQQFIGPLTPVGGLLFITGWIYIIIGIIKRNPDQH